MVNSWGASLAIVTLASGLAIGEIFFQRPGWFGLDLGVKTTEPPVVFGIEFGPNSDFFLGDGKIPTGGYGLVLLFVAAACCISVMRLRRSRLGELMLAVRANERAAAAAGVPETGKPCRQPLMGYRFPQSTMERLLEEDRVIFGTDESKDSNDDALKAGLGGTFSYFELGRPMRQESLLDGSHLPPWEKLASYVFFTANRTGVRSG